MFQCIASLLVIPTGSSEVIDLGCTYYNLIDSIPMDFVVRNECHIEINVIFEMGSG